MAKINEFWEENNPLFKQLIKSLYKKLEGMTNIYDSLESYQSLSNYYFDL